MPDPGPKPTDVGDEQKRRHASLVALHDAIESEERAVTLAAAVTAQHAATAMWLGASLADLAAVTGRTRQAARKRWPDLGDIHRRRQWLGNHVEEVLWAARVLLDNAGAIDTTDDATTLLQGLRDAVEKASHEFGEQARAGDAAERWLLLNDIVDVRIRGVIMSSTTADPQAEFALFGASGVVGYYDVAVARTQESSRPDDAL